MTNYSDRMLDPATPISIVADVLNETATRLSGKYIHLSETAPSAEESEAFLEKAFGVREKQKNFSYDSRKEMVAQIRELEGELKKLKGI